MYTIQDAANELGCSAGTVKRMIADMTLDGQRDGNGRLWLTQSDVDAMRRILAERRRVRKMA